MGVGAKYHKDSGNALIPRKQVGLLVRRVSVKVPSPACVILLSRAVTVQRVSACMLMWNSCSVLLQAGPGRRDKEQAHDWCRRREISWTM